MRLESKTSSVLGLTLMIAGFAVLTAFNTLIMSEFELLEDEQTSQSIARVGEAIQDEVRALELLSKDWSIWDDAFKFVQNPSDDFIQTNLIYDALHVIEFHHVGFIGKKLDLVYGTEIDDEGKTTKSLNEETTNKLIKSRILSKILESTSSTRGGFLEIAGKHYFIAASPIFDTARSSQPVGVFFATRELSDKLLQKVSQFAQVDLKASRLIGIRSEYQENSDFADYHNSFALAKISKGEVKTEALTKITDIFGDDFMSIQMSMPRKLYQKGLDARRFFSFALLSVGAVACLIGIILMRGLVINKVLRLNDSLQKITSRRKFEGRVEEMAPDELGMLATQINLTLATLQSAISAAESAQHNAELAQHQAESANAAKSSFIAKVSHELRTPIHSITGMLRILLKEERSGAKRNYIMMARNSAFGLLETINEILDFSKAEAGKLILENTDFSVHEVIREAMQIVGPRVEEKGSLELFVQIPQGIPDTLLGDPLRLRQVLVNLLGNATKFTKDGHIGLSTTILAREADQITIEFKVFDTGVGIPADRLEHIFEPFGQADESVSRMFTGTGLGLTIVKQFIEAMGGTVKVVSQVGHGSQFILTIPFAVSAGAKPVIYKPTLSSRQIALIDESSVTADRFAQELEDNGYVPEIIRCDDPAELNMLSRSLGQYGLIIVTSEALKRSRVFDLVVELRGRESVPVVSILSPFEISVRERLFALEVPFVVTRPISLLDILGVVNGDITLNTEGWNDSEEVVLQSDRPLEVLIADDAQTNRIILTELLRDAGHHVVCVENGIELLAKVRESFEGAANAPKFDLVLTDVQMPLLDGLNATSQIRALENGLARTTRLPVVAVTAHAMTEEVSRMRNFGVDDVVTKPLDPLRLGQVIQKLTGQSSASQNKVSSKSTTLSLTEDELAELSYRLWTQVARKDDSIIELFSLSEDPVSPEDFQLVLDIADVIDRSGNSVRRTLLIFNGFIECFREQLQKLQDAKHNRNVEQLRFASHALKGLLLDVGARASAGLASSIEQMCKTSGDEGFAHISQLTKQTLFVSRLISQIHNIASGNNNPLAETSPADKSERNDRLEQD